LDNVAASAKLYAWGTDQVVKLCSHRETKKAKTQVHTNYRVLLFEGIIHVNTFLAGEEYVFQHALEKCVRVGFWWQIKQWTNRKRTMLDAERCVCSIVALQASPSTLLHVEFITVQ